MRSFAAAMLAGVLGGVSILTAATPVSCGKTMSGMGELARARAKAIQYH